MGVPVGGHQEVITVIELGSTGHFCFGFSITGEMTQKRVVRSRQVAEGSVACRSRLPAPSRHRRVPAGLFAFPAQIHTQRKETRAQR